MPQLILPLIPDGVTEINELVSVSRGKPEWTYFMGVYPIFKHAEGDKDSFRMITAQLCCQGNCTQAQIMRAFGVTKKSVMRSVEKYRSGGVAAFYAPRKGRGPSVMTEEVSAKAQALLDLGHNRNDVARELNIKRDTIRKSIKAGKLHKSCQDGKDNYPDNGDPPIPHSDKSERSEADANAGQEMGIACTRPAERVLASLGILDSGAVMRFEACKDVSFGGVICALPALSENGLFRHLSELPVLSGYYITLHIILLLAYMALCRIKAVEQLQNEAPGELGKLMGLDRIPEVRCLRKKLAQLSQDKAPGRWAGILSKEWMSNDPEAAGRLYVDGHVRLYHGDKTKLPKRYVSRQRLCLRGTTDYWVNDKLGLPFFSVERTIDHGLLEALRNEIVPQLLKDVPGQPSDQQLEDDKLMSRFVIIFDREGYSPAFFKHMWKENRISCITYHKYPKELWPESWFKEEQTVMQRGEVITFRLAEMGSWVGDRKNGLWVREIRKLSEGGHQTSLISTVFNQDAAEVAACLFSRWAQENFFRYMMEHYEIDALCEYETEAISGTINPVINPDWRRLDQKYRSLKAKLIHRQARFANLTLHPEAEGEDIHRWERKKSDLQEEIEHLEHELHPLKDSLTSTPKHVAWDDMPEKEKFERLAPNRKRLTDTVKLVAYRAETAMAEIVRDKLSHPDEARAIVRQLYRSSADLTPDTGQNVLNVRIHSLASPRANHAAQHLLDCLNEAHYVYPGTTMQLVYTLANPPEKAFLVPT